MVVITSRKFVNCLNGSHDERFVSDETAKKAGLKREMGDPIVDSRVMDGFGVKFEGDKLCIYYHAEVLLKDVYGKDFEGEIDQI